MSRTTTAIAIAVLAVAASCGGSDAAPEPGTTTVTDAPVTQPPAVLPLEEAADAARAQVELGGLRADLDYSVADSLLNPSNECAAVIFIVDTGQGEQFVSTAYMVRIAGRSAVEVFPRSESMQPAYLARWDEVVSGSDWGLLALAPPETDVADVTTECGEGFLDEVLARHFAVQLAPE